MLYILIMHTTGEYIGYIGFVHLSSEWFMPNISKLYCLTSHWEWSIWWFTTTKFRIYLDHIYLSHFGHGYYVLCLHILQWCKVAIIARSFKCYSSVSHTVEHHQWHYSLSCGNMICLVNLTLCLKLTEVFPAEQIMTWGGSNAHECFPKCNETCNMFDQNTGLCHLVVHWTEYHHRWTQIQQSWLQKCLSSYLSPRSTQ